MSVRRFRQALFLAFALSLSATALRAQGISVFAMGGGSSIFDSSSFTASTGPFSSTYKTGGQFTVGVEAPIAFKILGLEGSYGYGRNNLALTNLGTMTEAGFNTRDQRLSGDLVLHSPVAILHLRPYVLAGLEYNRFSPVGSAASSAFEDLFSATLSPNNKIGFNYGGGVEWKLIHWVGLRLDVRDHVMGSPNFGLPGSSTTGGPIFPISGNAHVLEYSAGVVFHLGR